MSDTLTFGNTDFGGPYNVKSLTVDGDQVSFDISIPVFYDSLDETDELQEYINNVGYETEFGTTEISINDQTTNIQYSFAVSASEPVDDDAVGSSAPSGRPTDIIVSFTDIPAQSTSFQGTLIGQNPCFTSGTMLDTPAGPCSVEYLQPGDVVDTQGGPATISWVGHRRASDARVIRFHSHALGPRIPCRDLCVSHDHAMLVDGVLVPAHLLVNGRTIVEERWTVVTFYHVELDRHAILFAEGAPAESYLDTGNRAQFGNCSLSYNASAPGGDACAEMVVGGSRLDQALAAMPVPA